MSTFSTILLYLRFIPDFFLSLILIPCGNFFPRLSVTKRNMTKKNIVITGGNSGIGYEMAVQLAAMNASIYLACRNRQKGEDAARSIVNSIPGADVHVLELDTASFTSVRVFAKNWDSTGKTLDVLIHNAGIAKGPPGKPFTDDGFEMVYQTNFLGSFLLTHLLEPHLASDARVIFTSSAACYGGKVSSSFALKRSLNVTEVGFHTPGSFRGSSLYIQSKMMQVAFTRALQQHFLADPNTAHRSAHSFGPGLNATPIFDANKMGKTSMEDPTFHVLNFLLMLAIPVEQGAKTGVFLATDRGESVVSKQTGGYWDRQKRRVSNVDLFSQETIDRLWIRWSADAGIEWL